jgi:hypothetical protein
MENKRGQVTIFIILAIVIVGGVIAYFLLRDTLVEDIPEDMRPVYDYYLSCLEDTTRQGVSLLGEQGGYIELPKFEPGSAYAPFSSQLSFLGQAVPYWMYVSGNNLLKEQIPTKVGMEQQLSEYVSERVGDCDFRDFEAQGYDVYIGNNDVVASINALDVEVQVTNPITIYSGDRFITVTDHQFSLNSKLGKFYEMAVEVYNYEKSGMFLEEYALDVMRLYAPVTGTEITCTPKIFVDKDIRDGIVSGLTANIPTLKLDGSYYSLSEDKRKYFVSDAGIKVDENVNFMYSSDWPTKIEIYGDRVVEPIGLQQGLGILGFCYVPYQFVYDISFPVLVQFYDDQEVFQFPVSVVISKNAARESVPSTSGRSIESPVCDYKNQEVEVYTYDVNLDPVESRIRFKCLNSFCDIGETSTVGEDSILVANFPQCVNGFIIATADGYADAKYQISTNEETIANIVMNKKYNVSLDLGNVDKALVSFDGEDYSTTVLYPDMKFIELVEGSYNVSVYAYDNSSLKFPAVSDRKCVDVSEGGISGLFGATKEKCYDINIPEMDVTFAVVGGGKTQEYITESQLEDSKELNINVPLFGVPSDIEGLQANYQKAEEEFVYLTFE